MREIVIRKILTLSAITVICLIVGIAYGVAANDVTLMIMSSVICIADVYKIFELHRLNKNKKYMVVSGRCLESVYKFAGKYRVFHIQEGDNVIEISVPKNVKLKVNEKYNLYFKKNNLETEWYSEWLKNKILSENFLGYELISNEAEG